jgi:hypothetical protein
MTDDIAYRKINEFVAAAATMSEADFTAYQTEYLDQLTEHRRITRKTIEGVNEATRVCISNAGHKEPEVVRQVAELLTGAASTLREMAEVAEILRSKGAAIATAHERRAAGLAASRA